jgi:hypothetical protein
VTDDSDNRPVRIKLKSKVGFEGTPVDVGHDCRNVAGGDMLLDENISRQSSFE